MGAWKSTALKVISYGGGVQSTAMLVLANQGVIEGVNAALFSNVGDDSEHPATLAYIRDVATPRSHIPVHTLTHPKRTLMEDLQRDSRSINIPVRMANGAPGNRNCTHTYKVKVIGRWLKAHDASKDNPAEVCIGISTDEIHRVNRKRAEAYETPTYPLLTWAGPERLPAGHCGLRWPVPPKSSCYFCPFHRDLTWSEMRRDEPELFAKAVALEATLNERRAKLGKDDVYLTRHGKPLDQAIGEAQDMLPLIEWDTCDSGHCMT